MKKTGTILLAALAACILVSGCAAEAPRAESPTSSPAASSREKGVILRDVAVRNMVDAIRAEFA